MKKKLILGIAIAVGLIALRFIFSTGMQYIMTEKMKSSSIPEVTEGVVGSKIVSLQKEAPARVMASMRVDVVPGIDGYLTKTFFKEGDFVKKGQVLFEIDPEQWQYNLEQAKANVENTRAQLMYAEKQVVRSIILVKKDYISKDAYDEVVSKRDALKGQLKMYQAQVRDAERKYRYTRVKAPVSGKVGMIEVTVGNYVTTGNDVLTTIYSVDPIYVLFSLSNKEYNELQKADKNSSTDISRKVDFINSNDEKYEFSGKQNFQDNEVDESAGTIRVRAEFKNPSGKLLNGDIGRAIIYSDTKVEMPAVPQNVVMENPQGKYVYKLNAKGLPVINYIKTSGQSGAYWLVTDGLKINDKILTGGLQKVIPNRPVKIVESLAQNEENKEK